MKRFVIGADIGGSHISTVLVDLQTEQILTGSLVTRPVDNHATAGTILSQWVAAIRQSTQSIERESLAGIGFAMPGPFDYVNGIGMFEGNEKYENLKGVKIAVWLRELLNLDKSVQLRFMNDATSFAVGEAWLGKARNVNRSVAITLGTGFGSAFIEAGIPVVENKNVPEKGCLWHLPYREGIADAYFSTRWFERQYTQRTGKNITGVKELAMMAKQDKVARDLFAEFGTNLGDFIGPWLSAFKAGCLIMGGNIAGAFHLFKPTLKTQLKRIGVDSKISTSDLKEAGAMAGSARLFDSGFWLNVNPLLKMM